MNTIKHITLLAVVLLISLQAFCWGSAGHRITAQIAYSQLSRATKDSIAYYLGETSIEDASVWMDEIRSDHSYDYMKPWHYINIEKGASYDPASTDNIIWALNKVIGELRDRKKLSKEQIATDLKMYLKSLQKKPISCEISKMLINHKEKILN